MNSQRTLFASLIGAFLGVGSALGQGYYGPQVTPQPASELASPQTNLPVTQGAPYTGTPAGWSNWIVNHPCSCFGTNDGPPHVQYELFHRHGLSVPFKNGTFGEVLDPGYAFTGGARTLFFDTTETKAWTIETSISNYSNRAPVNQQQIPISQFVTFAPVVPGGAPFTQRVNFGQNGVPGVTVRAFNRTFVNLGAGREYYLWAPEECPGTNLRYGFDLGGRYGTSRAEFYEIRHRTDVIGGFYAALHSDLEWAFYCTHLTAGCRAEYGYTWSDILQQVSDLQEFTFQFNFGMRF